jgi:hypothetical protein
MRRIAPSVAAVLVVLSLAAFVRSQDDKEKSKTALKAGDNVPGAFHPFNVTGAWGERKAPKKDPKDPDMDLPGQFHDPISENNLDPCVLVFVHELEFSGGLLDLLQKLDNAAEKNPAVRLHVTAVFYSDKLPDVAGHAGDKNPINDKSDDQREEFAKLLKQKAADLKLKHVVLSLDGRGDIEPYLGDGDVTLVGYKRLKVEFVRSLSEKDLEAEVKSILSDVAAKLGAKR